MQRLIKVDGKVRTDMTFPAGFMDVVSIDKTGEHFRLIYDVKGRFTIHRITADEAQVIYLQQSSNSARLSRSRSDSVQFHMP